ncbi:MAG: grasp-with-spasm system ATP-grasp peptide maturase, partial [Candidatus Paceibacterota bacterium]
KELHSNNLISKAIGNSAMIRDGNQLLVSYTNSIDKEDLKYIGEKFSPSLFQNKIAKKYEVRAFYIEGAIYSMAIFSQRDSQTRIDFRRYNYSNPNRVTCFKLPKNVEDKLIRVAQQFQLNAASFDLIKTLDGDYVFLEVNPGGQFEMTSKPCNYFLEKIVAEQLAQYSS